MRPLPTPVFVTLLSAYNEFIIVDQFLCLVFVVICFSVYCLFFSFYNDLIILTELLCFSN